MITTNIYYDGEWICETTTLKIKINKKCRDYVRRLLIGKTNKRKVKKKK